MVSLNVVGHVPRVDGPKGGGEVTFDAVCGFLRDQGHRVTVLAESGVSRTESGIRVIAAPAPSRVLAIYRSADVLLTQRRSALQPLRELTHGHQRRSGSRLVRVFFSHNIGQPQTYGYVPEDLDVVVFNAQWTRRASRWRGRSIVMHPPVFPEQYRTNPGDLITQVNLSEKKGGRFFWELVEALPHRKFLAVLGKERSQVVPDSVPANCEVIENTPRIREDVYSRTRVLLVTSVGVQWNEHRRFQKSAESWGRVAVEAAASGIPAIAVPTPGLQESLGRAGCFLDLDAAAWSAEIERLFSDEKYFQRRSTVALERSAELHPAEQLAEFETELVKLVSRRRRNALARDRIRHPVRALTRGPKYSVRDFERGATLEGREDWLGAAEAYQAAVDRDPSQGEWFYRLGFVQQKRRAWDEAAEAFQAAVDRDPSQGEWFYRLGFVQQKRRAWDEAAEAYQAAVDRDPSRGEWFYRLGFVQQKRRAWDEAASAYRTALELNPDEARWIRRLETVQNRTLPGGSAS